MDSKSNEEGSVPVNNESNEEEPIPMETNEDEDMEVVAVTGAVTTDDDQKSLVDNSQPSANEDRDVIAPSPFEIINTTTNPPTTASSEAASTTEEAVRAERRCVGLSGSPPASERPQGHCQNAP